MKKLLLVLCVMLSLVGCESLDVVVSAGTLYCSAVPVEVREAALARAQGAFTSYPEHSICDTQGFLIDIVVPVE